jgi:hypothetical protein
MENIVRRDPHPESLKIVIAHYRRGDAQRAELANWWGAEGLPFAEAIDRAARARLPNGKRHPHQYRLSQSTLDLCATRLKENAPHLRAQPSFAELFMSISEIYEKILGAGPLATYDTADRIAYALGFEPRVIFLHAGTRQGVRRLLGRPFRRGEAFVYFWDYLPDGMKVLSPREAEDVFCSYKKDLFREPSELSHLIDSRPPLHCGPGGPAVC